MSRTVGLTFPTEAAESVEKFACPHCGKRYKSQEALEKHIRDKHSEAAEPPQE